jgi:chorismate-pyruvate lyase
MAGIKKRIHIDSVPPFEKTLLENKEMTTELLERFSKSFLVAQSSNRIRDNILFRQSVLIGAGSVMLFARSRIDISLLPKSAVDVIVEGKEPLGKILAKLEMETGRRNFEYFTISDDWQVTLMFSAAAAVSPVFKRLLWQICCSSSLFPGQALANIFLQSSQFVTGSGQAERYWARSYEICFGPDRVAWIEEIFSPYIKTRIRE